MPCSAAGGNGETDAGGICQVGGEQVEGGDPLAAPLACTQRGVQDDAIDGNFGLAPEAVERGSCEDMEARN